MIQECYNHPEREAIANCHYCHRYLCTDCAAWNSTWKYSYCKNEDECLKYRKANAPSVPIKEVGVEELVTLTMYEIEALIDLLTRKGIVSKEEIRKEIKKMRPKKNK